MRRYLFSVFIILFIVQPLFSQTEYSIQFKVDGWKDTTAYLGHYYSESTYIKDTAKVNQKGEFQFDGKKALGPGVYFLVLDKSKIFEFVIGKSQRFKMETSSADYVGNMKITGDPDNQLFFENWKYNIDRHKESEPFISILKDSTLDDTAKKDAREAVSRINEKVLAFQGELISRNPESVTALILKSAQPVKIPDPPKKTDGSIDSTFQLRWYRDHFFDNFDLSNEALLRMPRPVYSEKISEYLDKLFAPNADTLTKAVDAVISKAKNNQETFKYATWTCLLKYQQPDIMGLDQVYVNVYDKYFASGQMNYWMNDKLRKTVKETADRLRKSLIGKTAPNLIMQDAAKQPKALHDLKNRYTILYIFDPDCGHCKEETPKLVGFYTKNKTRFDVGVYAVSADSSMAKMKDYIRDMKIPFTVVNGPRTYVGPYQDHYDAITTPSLFIIDNKKKIIAKKIPAEKLEDFFIQYEKYHKPGAAQKAKAGLQ
jgi:peroxiredoxin